MINSKFKQTGYKPKVIYLLETNYFIRPFIRLLKCLLSQQVKDLQVILIFFKSLPIQKEISRQKVVNLNFTLQFSVYRFLNYFSVWICNYFSVWSDLISYILAQEISNSYFKVPTVKQLNVFQVSTDILK